MFRQPGEHNQPTEDFRFDQPPPHPDLLDYRHMSISMDKWAVTDSGCLSVVVCLGLAFACVLSMLAYAYLSGGA